MTKETKSTKSAEPMVTRTVKTWVARVAVIDLQTMTVALGDAVEYTAPSQSDGAARAAFRAAGKPQPRGTQFKHELKEEVKYGVPVSVFMEHAVKLD